MHYIRPIRHTPIALVAGEGHYDAVVKAVTKAQRSVWIATANLKELWIERDGWRRGKRQAYASIMEVFGELCERGVELRILHASMPSRAFRDEFDRHPRLMQGGLELRLCPRVHLKAVIVDAETLYLGSANWTGAGLGAKNQDRRNFEIGIVTSDPAMLDDVQELYDRIWRGAECGRCKLRDRCDAPLDC